MRGEAVDEAAGVTVPHDSEPTRGPSRDWQASAAPSGGRDPWRAARELAGVEGRDRVAHPLEVLLLLPQLSRSELLRRSLRAMARRAAVATANGGRRRDDCDRTDENARVHGPKTIRLSRLGVTRPAASRARSSPR